jgi:hypothetical protein
MVITVRLITNGIAAVVVGRSHHHAEEPTFVSRFADIVMMDITEDILAAVDITEDILAAVRPPRRVTTASWVCLYVVLHIGRSRIRMPAPLDVGSHDYPPCEIVSQIRPRQYTRRYPILCQISSKQICF